MIITLAGYNVEKEVLESLDAPSPETLTPEIFSAAYARISRSAKNITRLRQQAREDVVKARKSNKTIIFDMGHHSVAEHAVFNFDIIGVSRLALEEIEQFRLVSYTEKSQRYVTLKGDYVVPEEITDEADRRIFRDMVEMQNDYYRKAFTHLKGYLFNQYPAMAEKSSFRKVLEGWAKEDARYILSCATEGQVGMTINARNLEHLVRRFHLSRLSEVREIGKRMHESIKAVAPSIILFDRPSQFAADLVDSFPVCLRETAAVEAQPAAWGLEVVRHTENADEFILASFINRLQGISLNSALDAVRNMEKSEKERIFKELFKNMEFFDSTPREFEMPEVTFQAVLSASAFAQLKRHRLATLLTGDYRLNLGNVVPENIKITGLEDEFRKIIERTNDVYGDLRENCGQAADYILTNSHCRMVVMKMNLREIFHFARLRSDEHAQWEIRQLSDMLVEAVKPLMPLSTMLLSGKSEYVEKFENLYGRKPGFKI